MIRGDKISEISQEKPEISNNFLGIKPAEKMTDQELSAFIAGEFDKAHEESEMELHGRLLTDVFNCLEEDVEIDFSISDRLLEVLDSFTIKDWETFDADTKIEVMKELIQTISDELGLDKTPDLLLSGEEDSYGKYNAIDNTVTVNSDCFDDSTEIVNIIAHELRHAFQHMRADKMDTEEDLLYKVNFDNYIAPVALDGGEWLFFTDYMDQYVEVDARVFAKIITETMER